MGYSPDSTSNLLNHIDLFLWKYVIVLMDNLSIKIPCLLFYTYFYTYFPFLYIYCSYNSGHPELDAGAAPMQWIYIYFREKKKVYLGKQSAQIMGFFCSQVMSFSS